MVSIILLTYYNDHLTDACLESILHNTSKPYEIIIVDNGSDYSAGENKDNIKIIHNEKNKGFARGCNQGAEISRGEYLLFLNNDTLVTRNWLSTMVEVLEKDKKTGIVGCKLLFPDTGLIQHAGIIFHNRLPGHIYYEHDPQEVPIHQEKEYPAVTGACLLISKKLFREVDGFDERFINGYEDVDLCLKVRQMGYKVIYTPDALVYHYGSSSPGRNKYDKRNLYLLINKWKDSPLLEG